MFFSAVFKIFRVTEESQIADRAAAKPLVRQDKPSQHSSGA
jgi:hypothetical protein